MKTTFFIGCCTVLGGLVLSGASLAAAYHPASDATVVATLPGKAGRSGTTGEGRGDLRRPAPASAMDAARQYIESARREGDPRYLGHALGVLEPWPDARQAPVDVVVLRATIRQSLHQFIPALNDLDVVLQREPLHAQALLTRATVYQVLGRNAEAMRDCQALARVGGGLVASTCSSSVASVSGHGRPAYVMLNYTLQGAGENTDPGLRAWSHSVLAEIAERNGDVAAARGHFRAALQFDPGDRYVRAAYADLLLDDGDTMAALALVINDDTDDNLLLRRALALAQLRSPARQQAVATLAARYAAARQRADALHRREEARFALQLQGDPTRALRLAIANWAVQKEPADARILLQAAAAAGDRAHEQAARRWFRQAGVDDRYVERALTQVAVTLKERAS